MSILPGLCALALVSASPPAAEPTPIRYETRLVQVGDLSWRVEFQDRLQPVARHGAVTAWTADRPTLRALIERFAKDTRADIVQAPKVVAAPEATARVERVHKVHFISRLDRITQGPPARPTGLAFKPEQGEIEEGFRAQVSGRTLDQGILLKLGFQETRTLSMQTVTVPGEVFGPKGVTRINGQIQVPEVVTERVEGEWLVPTDHALIVSLGVHSVPEPVAGGPLRRVGSKASPRERIVVVDPGPVAPDTSPAPARPTAAFGPPGSTPVPPPAPVAGLPMPPNPHRSLPQPVAPDGSPVALPPLPDEAAKVAAYDETGAPRPSPQAPHVPAKPPGADRAHPASPAAPPAPPSPFPNRSYADISTKTDQEPQPPAPRTFSFALTPQVRLNVRVHGPTRLEPMQGPARIVDPNPVGRTIPDAVAEQVRRTLERYVRDEGLAELKDVSVRVNGKAVYECAFQAQGPDPLAGLEALTECARGLMETFSRRCSESVGLLTLPGAIRQAMASAEGARVVSCDGPSGPMAIAPAPGQDAGRFATEAAALVRSVAQQYWALTYERDRLRACEEVVRRAEEIHRKELARFEAGRGSRANLAEARQQLERFRLERMQAAADAARTQRQLGNLLGVSLGAHERILPATPPCRARVEPSWEDCLAKMGASQPDLIRQWSRACASLADVFSGGVPDAVREWALLQQVSHQTTHTLARFVLEVDANYQQYETARRLRDAADRRLDAAQAEYEAGRITIDRYLDALHQWGRARAVESQVLCTYNTALVALEEAQGTLLRYAGIDVITSPQPAGRRDDEAVRAGHVEEEESAEAEAEASTDPEPEAEPRGSRPLSLDEGRAGLIRRGMRVRLRRPEADDAAPPAPEADAEPADRTVTLRIPLGNKVAVQVRAAASKVPAAARILFGRDED